MRRSCALALSFAALLLTAACGGGGGDDPPVESAAAVPIESLCGTVRSDDVVEDASTLYVGDRDDGTCYRAVYTFDTDVLPAGAVVQSVLFATEQLETFGTPYASLGDVIVDHVDVGPTLDAADYGTMAGDLSIGRISTSEAQQVRVLDVTPYVVSDRAGGHTSTTFRLRFEQPTDGDGAFDYAAFSRLLPDPVGSLGLVIRYTVP